MQCLSFPGIAGDASGGTTLGLTEGAWTDPPASISYVWTADGVPIPSATASTYVVAAEDVGHAICCRVCAVGSDDGALTL